jgi:hypothetical protein
LFQTCRAQVDQLGGHECRQSGRLEIDLAQLDA